MMSLSAPCDATPRANLTASTYMSRSVLPVYILIVFSTSKPDLPISCSRLVGRKGFRRVGFPAAEPPQPTTCTVETGNSGLPVPHLPIPIATHFRFPFSIFRCVCKDARFNFLSLFPNHLPRWRSSLGYVPGVSTPIYDLRVRRDGVPIVSGLTMARIGAAHAAATCKHNCLVLLESRQSTAAAIASR